MPPHEQPADTLDAGSPKVGTADPPTQVAEADEIAQAELRAEAARARAKRLRQLAEAASGAGDSPSAAHNTDDEPQVSVAPDEGEAKTAPTRRWRLRSRLRLRRPSRRALAVVLVICASLTASGYIAWDHHRTSQERERATEYSSAARDAVLAMMSIDPDKARDQLQHFSDATTGMFKAGFLMNAEKFVASIEQSKASMKGTVQAVAVQSMSKNSAIVLVSAKSEMTRPDQPKPELRWWRLVLNVEREGSHLKVSRFEFVP
jgi:Mce-associated membrane protein